MRNSGRFYTIAIRPLQDFQAKVGSGRLFDMGGSTVNYGIIVPPPVNLRYLYGSAVFSHLKYFEVKTL